MSQFVIEGGNPIAGTWHVQGMKNAALPIIAATLLCEEPCTIHNIPSIRDVSHLIELMQTVGVSVTRINEHSITFQAKTITTHKLDYRLAKSMRASVLLIGPMLARTGSVILPEPGGCNLGNRPLDAHFKGFESLGATVASDKDGYYTIACASLQGGTVRLLERSVTATENMLMLAARTDATTIIENAATEPHVVNLAAFLRAMGAHISGDGTDGITVTGTSALHGAEIEIIPDQLEIGTMAVLGALAAEELRIEPVVRADMEVIKAKFLEAGVAIQETDNAWVVKKSPGIRAFNLETAPYPGFPTDLQAPFGLLATQASGTSTIYDPLFENRLGYLDQLASMGATTNILDAHRARIIGPTPLSGASINSLDIRAGGTVVIAGILARGETLIDNAEMIDRGYEDFDTRLRNIGARIRRV